jgi:polysaccharide pyruvyl transferase WcaK-like protein
MHYFTVGNDDRFFLNHVRQQLLPQCPNVHVQNEPMTLIETMEFFSKAKLNIGMRFHSVLLQTALSGKNIVLDYTEPGKGKISGFLQMIDPSGFYKGRYINLQESKVINESLGIHFPDEKFEIDKNVVDKMEFVYREALEAIA